MVIDSVLPASNAKDIIKKNRSNKLKHCKVDARRQQWQVKKEGGEAESNGGGEMDVSSMQVRNRRDHAIGVLEISRNNKENDCSVHNCSDSDLSSNERFVGNNCSGTNFSGSSRSNCSTSGTSYSGNISEEENHVGLDNWEAVPDALLAATGDKQERHDRRLELPLESMNVTQKKPFPQLVNQPASGMDGPRPKPVNKRAWRPGDAFRPKSLQKPVNKNSVPMKSDRRYGHGGTAWVCKNFVSAPSSCPICSEDLDMTDLSFHPCSCGFQLCLFCHKRIFEEDGRCPGCRKHYDNDVVKGGGNLDLGGGCAAVGAGSFW